MHVLLREYHERCQDVREAKKRAEDALKLACPPGALVSWRHGDHGRRGIVVDVYGDRVRVDSGGVAEPYWVHAARLRQVELPEESSC